MKKNFFKTMSLSLLFGSMCVGFVACSSDDDDENSGGEGKSPAQAIDLGLPSGTLWASCNVGATKPEEYGDYFAWGEVIGYKGGKTEFSWDNYKWANTLWTGQTINITLTKYSFHGYFGAIDGKKELDLEDDAAYVNWGINWRMPSREQIKELIDYCNWEWITLKGVKGMKATGPNGKSIFLPAAGERNGTLFKYVNDDGNYWSCSLGGDDWAHDLYIDWREGIGANSGSRDRQMGQSVRPVRIK
ncbi:MAG: hypothetical protein II934_08000 [Prevotella sp.]|nr:hypothetical protein [Prevotella sp.]